MKLLLVRCTDQSNSKASVKIGGLPSAAEPLQFEWPRCATCGQYMQFLMQVPLTETAAGLVFMCQNQPGLCDEWDPDAGGNVVKVVASNGSETIPPPGSAETTLPFQMDLDAVPFEQTYESALRDQTLVHRVLGKLGGAPDWIQADETPICNACGLAMSFVGQFEQATDGKVEVNYGGGLAYLFHCACSGASAKFLWQC
jgi:hypothetical protein